jgi:cytochrome c oxidase subunit IV
VKQRRIEVSGQMRTALYVVLMAAVIVAVDLLFFKNRFWERLAVNAGIVLLFTAFYFRFLKRP